MNKASDSTSQESAVAGDQGKGYLAQAQDIASNAFNSASKAATGKTSHQHHCLDHVWLKTDLANSISGSEKK